MNKLHDFKFNINEFNITPFFQSKEELRIRFGTEVFKGNIKTLEEIINYLFNRNEEIESTFIIGSKFNMQNEIKYNKIGLKSFFEITNWNEVLIESDDLEGTVVFATIGGLKPSGIFQYCKSIILGRIPQAYIMFYNNSFLLYISTDVLDIISKKEEDIIALKNNYSKIHTKYNA
ncbi:phosphatase [Lysinibacillus louembei]|uniref:Phosphatase n=1 Tax=Lysinibacillus louembei TaxID=1470088 RepID=A0ABZ0RZM1_9BACI|nr:phosphatase [Lysinibacillus louembei]WPK12742.1 phosphatase [Lysinibacillus louembei]